ncbi:hypothetical protein [Baaleninema simplex]|uniref:hypothetical protein n=1 Tax=Baaleninema simplex TaxID=2862350 RepID=UPI00034A8EE8|nr:hypothetical protein [Baaleninema simplex]
MNRRSVHGLGTMGLKGWGWIGLTLVGSLLTAEVRAGERKGFAEPETFLKGVVEVPATVPRVSVEAGTVEGQLDATSDTIFL